LCVEKRPIDGRLYWLSRPVGNSKCRLANELVNDTGGFLKLGAHQRDVTLACVPHASHEII